MRKSDEDNVMLVESAESVDQLNAHFYGRFNYPWSPSRFDALEDPCFYTRALNQDLGDWGHATVAGHPKIWVAGCGTNQAIFTALKFPKATVIGSDVSANSLQQCRNTADRLGLANLELRQESINRVTYEGRFDYVICTGVIHHNADPQATLAKLAAALKPAGILELMVYNRFHWIIPVAFQQAVRGIGGHEGPADFESELSIARRILDEMPPHYLLRSYLNKFTDGPEAMIADALIQPVIYSYTVESLEEMAAGCGLEILLPCLNQFDKATRTYSWNLEFSDAALRERYEALPDTARWQVSNLLMLDKSPMLWFYLQRVDSGRRRKTERQVCEEFLDTVFERASTTQINYLYDGENYELCPGAVPFPAALPDPSVQEIIEAVDGKTRMREIFQRLRMSTSFHSVSRARLLLTTSVFPYLRAVSGAEGNGSNGAQAHSHLAGAEVEKIKEANLNRLRQTKPTPLSILRGDH